MYEILTPVLAAENWIFSTKRKCGKYEERYIAIKTIPPHSIAFLPDNG
ncbi:hypothetical protein [Pleomorphovibrio marinus]|nr:hypothetical protein [Pleomorphovibrio marinus]